MINKYLQVLLVTSAFILSAGQSLAATIGFNNSSTSVNLGDAFSLTIQGSGFDPIVGGGLNMTFNSSVLQVNSVTIDQSVFEFYIGGGTEEGLLDNTTGNLFNTSFNSFFGASGDFDIMTIGFTAVGAGSSSLNLSESALWTFADIFGSPYGDQVVFESAMVNVSAVPVPAAVWLFGSGLIGLAGLARRRTDLK